MRCKRIRLTAPFSWPVRWFRQRGGARTADDIINLGVLCLKAQPYSDAGLRRTIATLNALPAPAAPAASRRRRAVVPCFALGVAMLSGGTWMAYLGSGPDLQPPPQTLPVPNAFDPYKSATEVQQDAGLVRLVLASRPAKTKPAQHVPPPYLTDAIMKGIDQLEAEVPATAPPRWNVSRTGTTNMEDPAAARLATVIDQKIANRLLANLSAQQRHTLEALPDFTWTKSRDALLDFQALSPAVQSALTEKLLQENQPALELIRIGRRLPYEEPRPEMPQWDSTQPRPQQLIAYYQGLLQLARLLALEARLRAAHGDWFGSVSSALDAISFGDQIANGADLDGRTASAVCQTIGRDPLWDAVDHLNAKQARAAGARLARICAGRLPLSASMAEAKARILSQISDTAYTRGPMGFFLRPLVRKTAASLHEAVRQIDQPMSEAPESPLPNDGISQMICPTLNLWKARTVDIAGTQTQNALLMTALALQAYRAEHGAYPRDLTALSPGYLSSPPSDPCVSTSRSPQILRYRLTASKYVLYSVGPDGRDHRIVRSRSQFYAPGSTDDRPGSIGAIIAGIDRDLPDVGQN